MRGCCVPRDSGLAHVSCLAEQAKILVAEAEENNLGNKMFNVRSGRGGTRAACASKRITALCTVRSDGRAGKRTWGGRRRIGFCAGR